MVLLEINCKLNICAQLTGISRRYRPGWRRYILAELSEEFGVGIDRQFLYVYVLFHLACQSSFSFKRPRLFYIYSQYRSLRPVSSSDLSKGDVLHPISVGGGVPAPYCSSRLSSGVGTLCVLSDTPSTFPFTTVEPQIFSGMKKMPLEVISATSSLQKCFSSPCGISTLLPFISSKFNHMFFLILACICLQVLPYSLFISSSMKS